jgi:HD-like signal output (HDOD) protein
MSADANPAPAPPSAADLNAEIQRFTQQLAVDVAGPPLELPSYPMVALRAQRVLMDPDAGVERVIAIIGSEPVLAAKILMMANSAALNRSGKQVTDLRSAVSRLGFDALRTAAISFAIAQLRNAAAYRNIAEPMKQLCQHSVEVAAISYVLARHCGPATPDSAMLAGLVSGMGKLYLLTRTSLFPILFADAWTRQEMFHSWHAQVARSILQNWQLAPEVVDAVAEIERAAMDQRTRVNLADVLACSQTILELQEFPEQLAAALTSSLAAQRLGLTPDSCIKLLADSADERAQLRRALAS